MNHAFRRLCLFSLVLLGSLSPSGLAAKEPAPALPPASKQLADAQDRAMEIILNASRSAQPLSRMRSMEAIQPVKKRRVPILQLGLEDPNEAVRFAALTSIAQLGLEELGPAARRVVNDPEATEQVRAAALVAARRTGQKVELTPIANLLLSGDAGQRANAAMLLGIAGDASAIPMLRDAAKNAIPRAHPVEQTVVRVQIAEALVKLGDEEALEPLHGAAYSKSPEVQVLAVDILGRLEDKAMVGNFTQFLRQDPVQLRMAAAEALLQIGRARGVPVVRILTEGAAHPEPVVRAQAAAGLGLSNDPDAAFVLVKLLEDADEQVRMSAASAVLKATHRSR